MIQLNRTTIWKDFPNMTLNIWLRKSDPLNILSSVLVYLILFESVFLVKLQIPAASTILRKGCVCLRFNAQIL